ncbi:MAG TPA: UDP-4-amino-4,6-dideoxy-N-acetyl-beta-L-altrosamine N-acetyltransferase [Candidatus Sulfotelmatobacter sp.]|nr:UDP-4-amino-4,6-dideoxy-N-acetyl-beta-L-altrosamine N-acetyltransferase [Candidatus Sulfotelmatobacter sp.]
MTSLRDVTSADQEKIRQWRNLPEVSKYMYTDHVISPEEHAAWFKRISGDPSCKYWIIVCDNEDVGVAWLFSIDRRNSRCYWGFYVASPNVRGKGVGSTVEYSVLRYVFDELRLNKLCGEVLGFNQVVVDMHKSFGFAQEGYFRKHVFKGGTMQDIFCIGMLREDWEAKKPEIESRLRAKGLIA